MDFPTGCRREGACEMARACWRPLYKVRYYFGEQNRLEDHPMECSGVWGSEFQAWIEEEGKSARACREGSKAPDSPSEGSRGIRD